MYQVYDWKRAAKTDAAVEKKTTLERGTTPHMEEEHGARILTYIHGRRTGVCIKVTSNSSG